MRKYQPPTREFFRLPNKIFQVPLDATQFKLYTYLVCCSGSKGYIWLVILRKQFGSLDSLLNRESTMQSTNSVRSTASAWAPPEIWIWE